MRQQTIEQIAELLKTVGHPVRIKIIRLLTEQVFLNVSTIQQSLQVEQALLSKHLIKLKDRGLIEKKRQGKENHYFLKDVSLGYLICDLTRGYV